MKLRQSIETVGAQSSGGDAICFSEDEWSPLEEVIVGRAKHSQFPSEKMSVMASVMTTCYLDEFRPDNPIPADIVEKADAELDNFAAVLESYGVKVHRPELVDWRQVGGYTGSMPRDGLIVVGNTVIESCFSWKCRRKEVQLAYGPILQILAKKNYHIVRAPEPPEVDRIFEVGPRARFRINNSRVAFDAADFTRLGKTVVGCLSHVTNEKGLEYVRAHLPAGYNLVVIESHDPRAMHIDTTLVPIMDGTAIYNPHKVSLDELRQHKPLNIWRLLPEPSKLEQHDYPPPYMSGPDLTINVLCHGKRVFCEKDDFRMQDFYRELGMEPIALPFKHVWSLGGSFHCATVDLKRKRCESVFYNTAASEVTYDSNREIIPFSNRLGNMEIKDRSTGFIEKSLPDLNGAKEEAADGLNETNPEHHIVIQEFRALIEGDASLFMLFHQMFEQIRSTPDSDFDPAGNRQTRNYEEMLAAMNFTIRRAPLFNVFFGSQLGAILSNLMKTPAGQAAFLSPAVNKALRNILNEWSRYLSSENSRYVLNTEPHTGWLGCDAMARMPNFEGDFVCDSSAPHYGFNSWDDFFTRRLRPGARPIASPQNENVIVNACESAPFCLELNAQPQDIFWLKSQPYSIEHMLAGDSLAQHFLGGIVYQAFLDEFAYHRWHSPVSGTILKAYVQEGTYYSRCPTETRVPDGLSKSQGYLSHMATRAIVFIQAQNPVIGLICFLAVGMMEVSSCEITAYEGQKVQKGDELGAFHYGGSTYCLLCRPEAPVKFNLRGQTPGINASNIPVNSMIATVEGQ